MALGVYSSLTLSGNSEKTQDFDWKEIKTPLNIGPREKTGPRLIPLSDITPAPAPFIDANDTPEIELRENSIIFYSNNGERTFTPTINFWSVSISPNKYMNKTEKVRNKDYKDYPEIPRMPEWYTKRLEDRAHSFYDDGTYASHEEGDIKCFLFYFYNEGGFFQYEELVDAVNKKIWQIPSHHPSHQADFLRVVPPFAWIGEPQGIMRMDLKTNNLTRFVLLPAFKDRIHWCDFQGKRYITSNEKFVQVLDIQSGNLSILDFREMALPSRYPRLSNIYIFVSNPVIMEGYLYISVSLDGRWDNFLLKYDLASEKWWFKKLRLDSRVNRLDVIKGRLWLNSSLKECDEGNCEYTGKIAFMEKTGDIHYFPEFDKREELVTKDYGERAISGVAPIRAFIYDEDNIYMLGLLSDGGEAYEKSIIVKFSGKDWKTVTVLPLCNIIKKLDGNTEYEVYEVRKSLRKLFERFDLDQFNTTENTLRTIQSWKVRYAMLEIPSGEAKPVDL